MALAKTDQNVRNIGAFTLLGLGFLLLIGIDKLWPLFIILPGIPFMVAYYSGSKNTAPLAVPGMLILGTGFLMLFQSITNYWESWSYAWTLYGVFLGMGLSMMGERLGERSLVQIGRVMTLLGGASFMTLGFIFILLTSSVFRLVLMVAFFGAGAYLLCGNRQESRPVIEAPKNKRSDAVVEENVRSVRVQVED